MQKLAVAFVIGLCTLLANAKEKPGKPVETQKNIICFPIKTLLNDIKKKYGEEPMVIGITQSNEDVGMTLFINKETGSYTVIEFDNEAGCVISVGNRIRYRYPKVDNML